MIDVLLWYVIVTLAGWLVWPLAFRMLPGLPDRGYTFSRALGLLAIGYIFWLLCSLGFLRNTVGGILFAAVIVTGISLSAYITRPDREASLTAWLKDHKATVITAESLFLIAFAVWAVVRAYNPDLNSTEKPMELAFLNGIRGSEIFPPRDPWLAGYSISYYYFGYVIMAMISDLAGTATGVAFNIGIALLFALTLLGSYGIVYNLIALRTSQTRSVFGPLLGPIMIGVIGNLEGLLELIRSLNLPVIGAPFWRWLDIEDLGEPLAARLWPPDQWRFWWWWRASRVIHDRDLAGVSIGLQPIDEFPFFSFLLGDMHPHVLALPFVLLALGLALNAISRLDRWSWREIGFYSVVFGGLAFLNTWDFPIYLFVLAGALLYRELRAASFSFSQIDVLRWLRTIGQITALGAVLYLPWYISFSSQAGGILPNALFPTRIQQFMVMFGPMLFVLGWFLLDHLARSGGGLNWQVAALAGGGLLVTLIALMIALGVAALRTDETARAYLLASTGVQAVGLPADQTAPLLLDAVGAVALHRLSYLLTALILTVVITLTLVCLLPRRNHRPDQTNDEISPPAVELPSAFVLILILAGTLLTLGPEFVYLRDVFGQRLNTIFKFYYAAWLLFGIAAAYGAHVLAEQVGGLQHVAVIVVFLLSAGVWAYRGDYLVAFITLGFVVFYSVRLFIRQAGDLRTIFVIALSLAIIGGLIYPILSVPTRSAEYQAGGAQPTLDGLDYVRRTYPGDYAAILWLIENAEPGSVVLEAVGGSYTYYGRVSSATGLPTLIGWPGHEAQWRGGRFGELAGGREEIVREIYNTPSVVRAQQLLAEYRVVYVFVGTLERDPSYAAAAGLQKFERFLPAVYGAEGVVIYRADQPLIVEDAP